MGAKQFLSVIQDIRGNEAVQEWKNLQTFMEPLASAAVALPSLSIREDPGAILTVGRYLPDIFQTALSVGPQRMGKLVGPFSELVDGVITDPFLVNWMDLLCFLLSGLPADGTIAAEMAFMFAEW